MCFATGFKTKKTSKILEIKFGSLKNTFYLCIPFQKRWKKTVSKKIKIENKKNKLILYLVCF